MDSLFEPSIISGTSLFLSVRSILDFAEFLQKKWAVGEVSVGKEMLIELAGGLENSKTFSGDMIEIQKRLRDEWE